MKNIIQRLLKNMTAAFPAGVIISVLLILSPFHAYSQSGDFSSFGRMLGKNDAIVITAPDNKILFSKNADKLLIPASTLKILTSLAAFHHLGKDYRFKTEFYLDSEKNLTIKGYGDPFLISEVLSVISRKLSEKIPGKTVHDIILDPSFFKTPITVPGVARNSDQPYDAPIGALCVNFNTVYFKTGPQKEIVSAEPQTPMIPFAVNKIKKAGASSGRIIFTGKDNENVYYAGNLIRRFLEQEGVRLSGGVRIGLESLKKSELIYTHRSSKTLDETVRGLMEFSNNFIANQILVTMGAEVYGAPGTLGKGVQAVNAYAEKYLGKDGYRIVEGSGISRQNRISANVLSDCLDLFKPFYRLMRKDGNEFYKTGTLNGIRSRAGYLSVADNTSYRFVVILNTRDKDIAEIMKKMKKIISGKQSPKH